MSLDIARLQIQVDSSGIKAAGRSLDSLSKKGMQAGKTLSTRLTLPLVAGFGASVREAALLEGAFDKFDVVFRGMNEEMREFVELYRDEFPLARREIVQHSAALQDLLVPMGVNRRMAADMVKEWMNLAGALSAFNDVPIERVLTAIRGGIAGETEALRRFGIDVRAAALEQTALQEGLIAVGEEMTEQVRVQAALIQATRQSADAVGGLEEQKGSLLWQMEQVKAEIKDLAAGIGEELMPEVKELTAEAIEWLQAFKDLDPETRRLIVRIGLISAAAGPALIAISLMGSGLNMLAIGGGKARKALRLLNGTMLANPYLAVAAAIGAVAAVVGTSLVMKSRQANRELRELTSGVREQTEAFKELKESMDDLSPDQLSNRYMELMRRQRELNVQVDSMSSVFGGMEISDEFFADMDRMGMSASEIAKWQEKGKIELGLSRAELKMIAGQMAVIEEEAEANLAVETQILRARRERLIEARDLSQADQALLIVMNNQIAANERILEQRRRMREDTERVQNQAPPKPFIAEPLRDEMMEVQVILTEFAESPSPFIRRWNEMWEQAGLSVMKVPKALRDGKTIFKSEIGEWNEIMRELDLSVPGMDAEAFSKPGSIGFVEQAIANMERQITSTTDEQARRRMQIRRDEYQAMLDEMRGATQSANSAAQDLGFTFSSAFEDAALNIREMNDLLGVTQALLQDIARIFLRQTVTQPLANDLTGLFSGIDFFGGTSGGGDVPAVSKQLGGQPVNVNVQVVNESSGADVEIQRQQSSDGSVALKAIVKDINKELFNSGQMDSTMRQFGAARKPINRG